MAARAATTSTLTVGDVRMTFVPDGSIHIAPDAFYSGDTAELFAANRHLQDEDGALVMSLGALLVEMAGRRVLVDLAWGPSSVGLDDVMGQRGAGRISGGALLDNLAALGVLPRDVDAVLLSHLHLDHVGWLATPAGADLVFDRAEYFLTEPEWEYWQAAHGSPRTGGPNAAQMELLGSRVTFLEDGASPAPGVTAMHTPGHTPGHCSFVVSSGTERAIVLGDTVHCPLEVSHPELTLLGDVDPTAGRATRERLITELAGETVAIGAHFPDVIFGRVLGGIGGRRLEPVGPAHDTNPSSH
jgi:glyoxylase-like metal-dependent hydrolase (beta-lactamase superfamily II)